MKTKVIVKKEILSLKELLPLGFKTTIIPKLSTKEKLIHSGFIFNRRTRKFEYFCEPIIAPIGSYEGFTFKAKNGKIYGDWMIHCKLEELFNKV